MGLPGRDAPWRTTLIAAAFEASLGLAAVALGGLLQRSIWEQMRGAPRDVAYGFLASVPLAIFFWLAMRHPVGPLGRLRTLTIRIVHTLFAGCSPGALLLIACLAGLGEELFFRGLVQQAIVERAGDWAGLAIASLAFGVLHALSLTYAVVATLVGAFLGGLCLATGNLVAAIVAHAAYDFLALWWLLHTFGLEADGPPATGRGADSN